MKPLPEPQNAQPTGKPGGQVLIGYLASFICLAGAGYYLWVTRDVLIFLLLLAVGTHQISLRRALKRLDPRDSE